MLRKKAASMATVAADGARRQSDTSTSATRIAITAAELATTTKQAPVVSSAQQHAVFMNLYCSWCINVIGVAGILSWVHLFLPPKSCRPFF